MPVSLASNAAATTHGALVPIAYSLGTSSGVEIVFNNIPQIYQDLRLVINSIPSNSTTIPAIYFNGTTGNTCSNTWLAGNGSAASSSRNTGQVAIYSTGYTFSTSNPSSMTIDILNYRNTSTFKTTLSRIASDQNGSGYTLLSTGLCQTTSAISQIALSTLNGGYYWTTGTTVELFGVRTVGQ